MNKTVAIEWLTIAYHDLQSAQILFAADHYTDSIGCDLQQAIEKTLKAVIASKNHKIPKSHDLYEIYDTLEEIMLNDDQIDILYLATEYYKEDRYPNPNYSLPPRKEIEKVINFTKEFFEKVCNALNIESEDLKGKKA